MFNTGCIFTVADRTCTITGSLPAARIVLALGEFLTGQVDITDAKCEAVNEGRGESRRQKCFFFQSEACDIPKINTAHASRGQFLYIRVKNISRME